uniref:Uncharacterized protein n=1 Tax=Trypanosoma congolense (strain IL3000) TaxID=1068625 RepID=G0V186_TRYCI|nr:hypothetical protein, unlikely [Trypanosoma congolense IL3000]
MSWGSGSHLLGCALASPLDASHLVGSHVIHLHRTPSFPIFFFLSLVAAGRHVSRSSISAAVNTRGTSPTVEKVILLFSRPSSSSSSHLFTYFMGTLFFFFCCLPFPHSFGFEGFIFSFEFSPSFLCGEFNSLFIHWTHFGF